ncbi:MAG: nicotinate-nucleotide adenylyltransferase [Prochlorothrix sp.]|nr:nicotinate-nucleotide adenylyltransferase [Prochlorothrix sp.]
MSLSLALFGTSADPPTVGHGQILTYLSQNFQQVAVWASDNPFKTHGASLQQRQEMLRLLLSDLALNPQQVQLAPHLSHRRTLHTLETAQQHWPTATFTLVIGSDLVTQLPQWYQVQALLRHVNLLVVPRAAAPLKASAIDTLQAHTTVTIAPFTGPPVSSSAVREQGDTTALSPSVHHYIQAHQLYPCVPPCPPPRPPLPSIPPQS